MKCYWVISGSNIHSPGKDLAGCPGVKQSFQEGPGNLAWCPGVKQTFQEGPDDTSTLQGVLGSHGPFKRVWMTPQPCRVSCCQSDLPRGSHTSLPADVPCCAGSIDLLLFWDRVVGIFTKLTFTSTFWESFRSQTTNWNKNDIYWRGTRVRGIIL